MNKYVSVSNDELNYIANLTDEFGEMEISDEPTLADEIFASIKDFVISNQKY